MSNPPPPPRRPRGLPARPESDEPPEGPSGSEARHQASQEPVYNLDDVGDETPEALKEAMVRDVVEHAARVTRAVQLAKPMESYRARPMLLALAAVASLIVATYAYVAQAPWVFGPSPHHLQPAAREEHVRYAMFLTVARVLTFRDSTGGALPRTLAQVGESWPGMSYHVQQDTFELRAHIDSSTAIVYRSTQDPAELAASATGFLRDRLP